jgi:hypothetical protein
LNNVKGALFWLDSIKLLYVDAANKEKRSSTNIPMKSSIRITNVKRGSYIWVGYTKKTLSKMQRGLKMKKSGIGEIGTEEKRIVSIACYHVGKTIISFQ